MRLRGCFFFLASVSFLCAFGSHIEDDCHDKIELGLLIDISSSYGEGEEWRKVKLFVTLFLNYYEIDANKTRLGVITYGRNAKILFKLHDQEYQTSEAATKAIETALEGVEPGGNPLTEKALTKAHDVLFEKPPQSNKQRVLFVFTGGKTPNPQLYDDIVRSIEDKGVNIVAVSWDRDEAIKIAGKRGHAIYVQDIYDALYKLPEIVESTCLIHGGYTEWNEWSSCSKTCGGGQQSRYRTCSNPVPSDKGRNCDDLGPSNDRRPCNSQRCGDIDGGYSEWTAWSACSHTCGGGRMKRHRLCVNPPQQDNGKFCDILGPAVETKACSRTACKGANTAPCEQGLDLAILLDQSLSVRRRNLKALLKTLLPPYIEMLRISPRKTHVGLIRFHRTSHLDFNFADHRFDSTKKLKSEINSIDPVTFYKTRIDRGLLSARYEMFTKRAGDRTSKQNVLLVFTDGKPFPRRRVLPFNETIPPLREEKKAHIVAVGYGVDVKRKVLEEIGGDNVLVMYLNPVSGYASYAKRIGEMVCTVHGGYTQWSFWSLCSASCGAGTQTRSRDCTAPPRRKGGNDCKGDFSEVRACGEVYCPHVPPKCKDSMFDLAIVFEASSELGLEHFLSGIEFIGKLLPMFDISPTATRVNVVLFNAIAFSVVAFDQPYYQNIDALKAGVQYLPRYLPSGKRLDKALQYVNDNVFTVERGDRPDAKNVAVFLTDGWIHGGNDISGIVSALRDEKKVNMVTVSSGTDIREEVLYEIAGPRMALCTSFQDMAAKVEKIAGLACDIPE